MISPYLRFRHEFIALDPERYPAAYIDGRVTMGNWRCWGDDKAAILAEIKTYPSGLKEVHGVAATGDLQAIVALIPEAEEWGRLNGCTRAVIESTVGWAHLIPDYRPHQLSLRKEL